MQISKDCSAKVWVIFHFTLYMYISSQRAEASFPAFLTKNMIPGLALESSNKILVDENDNAEYTSRSSTRKYMIDC